MQTLEKLGWTSELFSGQGLSDFQTRLGRGEKIITLNHLGQDKGFLTQTEGDVAHFVQVISIIPNLKDETNPTVRIYNPYFDREELYGWKFFQGTFYNKDWSNLTTTQK